MWRFLLIISVIPIVVAFLLRWFLGLRVLAVEGERSCRCNLDTWMPPPSDTSVIHREVGSALEFGRQLREKALIDWYSTQPKAAKSRENSRRFGMAVPPLSGIVGLMGVLVAKIPPIGGLSIFVVATALSAVTGILALGPELTAIARAAKKLRESNHFPNSEDEEAVIRCAKALAWKETLPPILCLLQR